MNYASIDNTNGILPGLRLRVGVRGAIALLACVAVAGCDVDNILDVDDPDVIVPGQIGGAESLTAVHANAIAEFSVAYSGNPDIDEEGQIQLSGVLVDELIHTGTFDSREIVDRRVVTATNPTAAGPYIALHRARAAADNAADFFAQFGPNTERHADAQNLEGFAQVLFGENYCSGVPFSRLAEDGEELEFGEPQTTTEVFEAALASFDQALGIATAAGSDLQANLARVGRARALLGLGRYEDAAAAASAVPTDFEYLMYHSLSTARQHNGVWTYVTNSGIYSVSNPVDTFGDPLEVNALPYRLRGDVDGAIQDPRIPTELVGLAQRGTLRPFEHWGQLKFPTRSSPVTLANGIEARLIEAEAELRRGAAGVADFVDIHNELRADVGLPLLDEDDVAAMTQDEREALHFEERAYWLYLTSHRLGDLRRMMWDYGWEADELFPIGTYWRTGAPMGSDTNLNVYIDEEQNPNFTSCLTRDDSAGRDA